MGLAAGKLNRLITIQQRGVGVDALNQPLSVWNTLAVVYANVVGSTGMANIRQSTTSEEGLTREVNAYSFRIRYRTDVNAKMRVMLEGVPYDIKQVRHDHANREWTDLVCEVGGNAD